MDEVSKEAREKSLECSIKDGAAFSVMTGFGEQYFSPLAIELGASNMQIGLLASLPSFIASLLQLSTSRGLEYFKSRRRIITTFVLLQALTWVPLVLIPLLCAGDRISPLIFFVTLYFVFGQFIGPVWNSLMGDLVDENMRGRFFGRRNMITGAVAFVSLFTAGLILGWFPKHMILRSFALIFSVAFVARLVSWYYLNKTADPPFKIDQTSEFSFIQYSKKLVETNYGKFALYVGAMNFSVNIAAPFFTVYMLRDINLSYPEYTIVTATAALTSFIAMAYWGDIADRFGNRSVLNFCGILVSLVPILWLFSKSVVYLIFVQILSGLVWAGFNLSAANFMFDNVGPIKRPRVFSYHNVLAGSSVFLGAVLGGILAHTITFKWIFHSNLQILFLISGLLRASTSLFFLPKIREVRDVEYITTKNFFMKYSGTGPILGLTYRTVTGLQSHLHKKGKSTTPP